MYTYQLSKNFVHNAGAVHGDSSFTEPTMMEAEEENNEPEEEMNQVEHDENQNVSPKKGSSTPSTPLKENQPAVQLPQVQPKTESSTPSTPLTENIQPAIQLTQDQHKTDCDSQVMSIKANHVNPTKADITPSKAPRSPLKTTQVIRKTPQKTADGVFAVPKQMDSSPLKLDIPEEGLPIDQSMPPTPTESNFSEDNEIVLDSSVQKKRRDFNSPLAMKYRIRCQCGANNCRQWLY